MLMVLATTNDVEDPRILYGINSSILKTYFNVLFGCFKTFNGFK